MAGGFGCSGARWAPVPPVTRATEGRTPPRVARVGTHLLRSQAEAEESRPAEEVAAGAATGFCPGRLLGRTRPLPPRRPRRTRIRLVFRGLGDAILLAVLWGTGTRMRPVFRAQTGLQLRQFLLDEVRSETFQI